MPTYRELLEQVKAEIDEISTADAAARADAPLFVDVRERDEWDEGHIPGAVHVPRGNLESRVEGLAPDRSRTIVVYCAVGARSAFAAKTLSELGYEDVRLARGRLHRLEAERLPDAAPAHALPRPAQPLLAPPADPRGRRGGPAQAARREGAADRRRRPRLARVALPRRRGRRPPRHRRRATSSTSRTSSARSSTRPTRSASRRSSRRKRTIEALNPDVEVRRLRGAADLGERRPHPRRRLGRDRRRRRQLPDALPRQRRVGVARDPGRARLDLPLRGPGDRLRAARGAVLPLPLPDAAAAGARAVVRRGRRPRRAARHRRLAPGERGAEARARHRRPARRPAAALRRAPHRRSPRWRCGATRTARSAASTRRSRSTSTTSSSAPGRGPRRERRPHPADAARPRRAARARSRSPARRCARCSRTSASGSRRSARGSSRTAASRST